MPYVNNIKEDGVTYDIQAKALDPTLDATILRKSELVNGFTQTTPGVNALDAAAGKTLNDSLANNARMVTLSSGQSATVTFSTYQTVALIFTTHNNSNYEMFMYANGYIAKNATDTGLTATLSSDYKTVTLNNASGQYYYIGILHPGTATMTISAPN